MVIASLRTRPLYQEVGGRGPPPGPTSEVGVLLLRQPESVGHLDEGRQVDLGFLPVQREDHGLLLHPGGPEQQQGRVSWKIHVSDFQC